MPHDALPEFMARLRAKPLTVGRVALEALILTAVRSGEIRGARWPELNKDFSVWTIPGDRMKAGVTHAIPLSKQAAAAFRTAAGFKVADCDLVFPGQIFQSPLSDMTLLEIVRGMNTGVTVHGFRSTFRDWVADITNYPREVAEAALAHTLENKVEAAYRRTDFFAKRRKLMEDWADYCDGGALDKEATGHPRHAEPVQQRRRRSTVSSRTIRQRASA